MIDFRHVIQKQREFFLSGQTRKVAFRLQQLKVLQAAVRANEDAILQVLAKDLNKAPFEGYATEVGILLDEIKFMQKHTARWAKPEKVKTPLAQFKATSYIYPEPYGVALIMAPWNYPFQLAMAPLVGAIAAGNCAIIKPSEYAPATSALIARLVRENFAEEYIAVVEGGLEVNEALLVEKFDYIFFTGSVAVGKIIMRAASEYLTPVTLELGGKSPCIVDREANLEVAARRIVWGKFLNCGQTCVAPDYVLVHSAVKEDLLALMQKYITNFYGDNPCTNPEYTRVVNERHFRRLLGLLGTGKIVSGGTYNEQSLHIAPTIIDRVSWADPIMQEEIFGPLLPILEYTDLAEVIKLVNDRPKPLALYLFTTNRQLEQMIIENISFGGGCINDTIVHLATSHMPFGGVGESGMGGYHGKASFDTFTHRKSVLKKSNALDIPLRYPPYKDNLRILRKVLK